ncbi:MAG: hypothetical protein MJK13_19250 [Pseudomonadales bacterium]|nr:hypothetical protein [Pseudomonadales bacterium]
MFNQLRDPLIAAISLLQPANSEKTAAANVPLLPAALSAETLLALG